MDLDPFKFRQALQNVFLRKSARIAFYDKSMSLAVGDDRCDDFKHSGRIVRKANVDRFICVAVEGRGIAYGFLGVEVGLRSDSLGRQSN